MEGTPISSSTSGGALDVAGAQVLVGVAHAGIDHLHPDLAVGRRVDLDLFGLPGLVCPEHTTAACHRPQYRPRAIVPRQSDPGPVPRTGRYRRLSCLRVRKPAPRGLPIEISGLTKHFGSVLAVDDLGFSVEPGRVTGFLGPNGSGKTTTLRMLLGLVAPNAGRATVGGQLYRTCPSLGHGGRRARSDQLPPVAPARTHLRMVARAGGHDEARADVVLDLVGLTADAKRKVGGFSMGMRQRLELASAMIGDPDVLILDEPSNGLDPQGIAWLRDFMRYLAGEGRPSWSRRTSWPRWPRPSTTP